MPTIRDLRLLDIDEQTIRENQRLFARGQIYGFVLAIVFALIGAGTALYGATIADSLIGTGGLVALVTAFLNSAPKGALPGEVNEGQSPRSEEPTEK